MGLERGVLRVFSGYRDKRKSVERLVRLYPRVFRLFAEHRRIGVCPICGRRLRGALGFAAHYGRGEGCKAIIGYIAHLMSSGAPESEVLRFINEARLLHGLPELDIESPLNSIEPLGRVRTRLPRQRA